MRGFQEFSRLKMPTRSKFSGNGSRCQVACQDFGESPSSFCLSFIPLVIIIATTATAVAHRSTGHQSNELAARQATQASAYAVAVDSNPASRSVLTCSTQHTPKTMAMMASSFISNSNPGKHGGHHHPLEPGIQRKQCTDIFPLNRIS